MVWQHAGQGRVISWFGRTIQPQLPGNCRSGGSIGTGMRKREEEAREKLRSWGDIQYLLQSWNVSVCVEEAIEFACWTPPTTHTHSSIRPQSTCHAHSKSIIFLLPNNAGPAVQQAEVIAILGGIKIELQLITSLWISLLSCPFLTLH